MPEIDLTPDFTTQFSPSDLAKLREIVSSPLYLKLLQVINRMKPSPNCQAAGSKERDAFSNERANARLGEIRGWEMHQLVIVSILAGPKPPRQGAEETFAPGGALDLEPTSEPMPGQPSASPSPRGRSTRKPRG